MSTKKRLSKQVVSNKELIDKGILDKNEELASIRNQLWSEKEKNVKLENRVRIFSKQVSITRKKLYELNIIDYNKRVIRALEQMREALSQVTETAPIKIFNFISGIFKIRKIKYRNYISQKLTE